MKSVLLIRPPERYLPHRARPMVSLPLGLLYIASSLEQKGKKVQILDGTIPQEEGRVGNAPENFFGVSFEDMKNRIGEKDFDVAGIWAQYSFQWDNALKTASICKEVNPQCKVIMGGAHVSVLFDDLIRKYDCVDIVVRGEGEFVMPQLLERIAYGLPLEGIPGIAYRKNGLIEKNQEPAYIKDLDCLPIPAYHLVDMEKYFRLGKEYSSRTAYQFEGWERGLSLITSRGCPYNCVFCSIHLHMGRQWRAHSAEYVLKHIAYLIKNYNVKYLHFEDDNLTLEPERFVAILDGLLANDWNLRWDTPNGVRVEAFNERILRKCSQTGCTFLIFGVESGSQRVLDEVIGKSLDLSKLEDILLQAKKIGVDTRAFFMMGLPGETKQDIKTSVNYALKLIWRYECFGGFSMAVPLFGTRLYDVCDKEGYFNLEPTIDNLSSAYLKQGIIKTKQFDPEFLESQIRYFEKKSSVLLFWVFMKKLLRDWRLVLYVTLNLLRTAPKKWSAIYYKAVFFHHSLIFDMKAHK